MTKLMLATPQRVNPIPRGGLTKIGCSINCYLVFLFSCGASPTKKKNNKNNMLVFGATVHRFQSRLKFNFHSVIMFPNFPFPLKLDYISMR